MIENLLLLLSVGLPLLWYKIAFILKKQQRNSPYPHSNQERRKDFIFSVISCLEVLEGLMSVLPNLNLHQGRDRGKTQIPGREKQQVLIKEVGGRLTQRNLEQKIMGKNIQSTAYGRSIVSNFLSQSSCSRVDLIHNVLAFEGLFEVQMSISPKLDLRKRGNRCCLRQLLRD